MGQSEIPKYLIDQVQEGRAVPVLGAGASLGARRADGTSVPTSETLAKEIAKKFLGDISHNSDLAWIAELASSTSSRSVVQDFIASQLANLQPADHHRLLPTFRWRGIATTNYDRVVETSYESATQKIQEVVPFFSNDDRVDAKLRDPAHVGLLKLHGCITRTHDDRLPLILTADQYVTHRENRVRVFQMLEEWASENTLLFVGHSLRDSDLRKLLLDLLNHLGGHPQFFMVRPEVDELERDFWAKKNISVLPMTYSEFLQKLDIALPRQLRPLLKRLEIDHPIRKHFITQVPPSRALLESLEYDWEYVFEGMAVEPGDPKLFYSGFGLGWYPIQANLDVRRSLSSTLIEDIFLRVEDDRPTTVEFYVVKAEAGAGKSLVLRRTAWDAAVQAGALILYTRSGRLPGAGVIQELSVSTGDRIFIFIENPATDPHPLARLLAEVRQRRLRVTFITAERVNEWNVRCESLDDYISGQYVLGYLSESEIGSLVDLLERHNALGTRLIHFTRNERIQEFAKQADRQILVALHVATLGEPFEDILYNEYQRILPPEAQRLYLTICVLNRLKVPVRAGVVSRVHQIPFEDFQKRLFKPLEHVVHPVKLPWGDMAYRTRHAEIADIVFRRVLNEPTDRYNEIVRLLGVLNPLFSTDLQALKGLLRARSVHELFPSNDDAKALYGAAAEVLGERNVYLLQQRANYERIRLNGDLHLATSLLRQAKDLDPRDETVVHTFAEVLRKRAEEAKDSLERKRYRTEAMVLLQALSPDGPSAKFAIVTKVNIALEGVADLLRADTASDREIDDAVRDAEKMINEARQRYPGEAHVVSLEAKLAQILQDDNRTYMALVKAHRANKRDPFIANRLAATLISKGNITEAKTVIGEALSNNRSDKRLNYMYAEIERQSANRIIGDLVHYYRKGFTRWDSNYDSQFWFARFAWEVGSEELKTEAKEVFRHLRDAAVPHSERVRIRDLMMTGGQAIEYFGAVARLETSHGFLRIDGTGDWIFCHKNDVPETAWQDLRTERRVAFHLGFSLGGPVAINIRLEGY